MEKLYPIIKKAKTCLGHELEDGDPIAMTLAYCPVCNKRLSVKKVHPRLGDPFGYQYIKEKQGDGLVGKPIHCERCGSLIHPLS